MRFLVVIFKPKVDSLYSSFILLILHSKRGNMYIQLIKKQPTIVLYIAVGR